MAIYYDGIQMKASERNTEHLQVMATKKLKAAIKGRAKTLGLTVSEYFRALAIKDLDGDNGQQKSG